MFYMHGIGWGWWLLMSIGMVAFWALVINGFVWLLRSQGTERREEPSRETPEGILKRRLASGEISVEQYRQLAEALDDDNPGAHSLAA